MTPIERQHDANAGEVDFDSNYQLVRYRQNFYTKVGALIPPPYPVTRIEATGDHLTVAQVHGSAAVFARVGGNRNPWIRLRPQMVIKRTFRTVFFTVQDDYFNQASNTMNTHFAEAVCYASTGPLIEWGEGLGPGVQAGLITGTVGVPASPGTVDLLRVVNTMPLTVGSITGWLQIHNTAGSFEIIYGNWPPAGNGWVMLAPPDPSSVLVLPIRGLMWGGDNGAQAFSLFARGVGGGGTLNYLWSPAEMDSTLPDLPNVVLPGSLG